MLPARIASWLDSCCPMFHLCISVRQNIIRYHLGDHVSYSKHPSAHQVAARLKDMRRRDSVVYWSGFMLWRWRLFLASLPSKMNQDDRYHANDIWLHMIIILSSNISLEMWPSSCAHQPQRCPSSSLKTHQGDQWGTITSTYQIHWSAGPKVNRSSWSHGWS